MTFSLHGVYLLGLLLRGRTSAAPSATPLFCFFQTQRLLGFSARRGTISFSARAVASLFIVPYGSGYFLESTVFLIFICNLLLLAAGGITLFRKRLPAAIVTPVFAPLFLLSSFMFA